MNNNQLTEGEQNTCELCADYNMCDCDKCELNNKDGEKYVHKSDSIRSDNDVNS